MTEHLQLTLSDVAWPGTWAHRGACVGMRPDPFFGQDPDGTPARGGRVQQLLDLAVRVCNSCQVQDECLAYRLANPELRGVWGGKRPAELARMDYELRLTVTSVTTIRTEARCRRSAQPGT